MKKKYLAGDICFGLLGGILSIIPTVIFLPIQHHLAFFPAIDNNDKCISTLILRLISLAIVSGFLKELYFRNMAVHLLGKIMIINTALLLTNILFGIIDWYNLGDSFLSGFIWIALYKKRKRLIVPIIAHSSINIIGVLYQYFMC